MGPLNLLETFSCMLYVACHTRRLQTIPLGLLSQYLCILFPLRSCDSTSLFTHSLVLFTVSSVLSLLALHMSSHTHTHIHACICVLIFVYLLVQLRTADILLKKASFLPSLHSLLGPALSLRLAVLQWLSTTVCFMSIQL